MFTFPKTLANTLLQYPTSRQVRYSTQVLRFVGGKEQRYALAGVPLRRWELRPKLLTDEAMIELTTFYETVGGNASSFQFTDPWDGTSCPVCYFESDRLVYELLEQGRNMVSFSIVEGR